MNDAKSSPAKASNPFQNGTGIRDFGITMNIPYNFLRVINIGFHGTAFDRYHQKEINISDLSEVFHENSKLNRAKMKEITASTNVFRHPKMLKAVSNIFPCYPEATKIYLPKKDMHIGKHLSLCLAKRRSIRSFAPEPLTIEDLSKLLHYSCGITGFISIEGIRLYLRASPSAGALYPLEIYPIVFNVKNLEEGIYHYSTKEHALEKVENKGSFREKLADAFPIHTEVIDLEKAAIIFLLKAAFWRSKAKYGIAGYRYILQESGHIAQNILLVATALKLGAIPLVGFFEDEVNEVIGIDGIDESVIYAIPVGKPEQVLRKEARK